MEFVNGTYEIISIKFNGEYVPIGCLTDQSFSESTDTLETTVRTNKKAFKTYVGVGQSYNIDINGLVSKKSREAGYITYYDLLVLKRNITTIEWKISGGVDLVEYGEGILTSINKNSTIDEFISFSATILGQGTPRENPQIEGGLEYILQHKL